MEVITRNSVYLVANRQVYKREGQGGVKEVGKFVALSQAMPSGGAVPQEQKNDLPLRLWYTDSELRLFQTSPIVAINP